ncbi:hypothetical protein FFLO_00722 [Filobasidium floriforme]|uniref:Translation initiation factor IF2/IF5 domain-containing protein n=1 Tax=Filobasidium floriforme TaxID=5210 RepID=A0A8K0JSK2_9TREE|nr:translation initiation factor [Filobasidium floriforme]KAG7571370.1 hypothetical protein FFLO_00722 [Filobasidium floriforme]KAH8086324.1 translation initiation factor [Filobasidium floriforme]
MSADAPPAEEPMFAGLKKKSKKAKVNFDEIDLEGGEDKAITPANIASETIAQAEEKLDGGDAPVAAEEDMFADLKKKPKKKKKEIPMDLEELATPEGETATPAESAGVDMGEFGDIKKKKKSSKKKAAFDLEAFEKEIGEAEANEDGEVDDNIPEGDLGDDIFTSSNDAAPSSSKIGEEAWVGTSRDYTYPELLNRFYSMLHSHNPELAGDKKKLTLVPPQVTREGTKKTMFANLAEICRRMHRQPKHLMEFLFAELGTSGSVDAQQRLIIKGRYTQKSMENVLRRYIVEYVVCKTCKSPDTLLNKENRLYFITCESCGSRRSVAAIKTGFQAQVGRRIKPAA